MPPLWQIILGAVTVICSVLTAVYSDRMAKELRNTGEARYDNPRVIPGSPYRQNDLLVNYRQRFPNSRTSRTYTIFAYLMYGSIMAVLISLSVQQHQTRMEQSQPLNTTDR